MEMLLILDLFFSLYSRLKAKDVMSKKLSVIFPHTRVSTLIRILKTTVYNAFPVVTMPRPSDKIHIESDIEQVSMLELGVTADFMFC